MLNDGGAGKAGVASPPPPVDTPPTVGFGTFVLNIVLTLTKPVAIIAIA